jgi:hypothetical protein
MIPVKMTCGSDRKDREGKESRVMASITTQPAILRVWKRTEGIPEGFPAWNYPVR